MTHQLATTGAASAPAAPITAADQARIDQALRDARAWNTRRQYRSAWKGWAEWAGLQGHQALPADPAAVAAYLAERTEQGAAASTVRAARAAIGAAHRDQGADDPTAHDGVRRVLQGLTRQAAGRGRGQAQGLTADDCAAILATASLPRRIGRGVESETAAAERGAVDKAIVGLLFQGGLRRSEAAALRWADVQDATDGRGVLVYVRRSKTDQDGTAAPAPPRPCLPEGGRLRAWSPHYSATAEQGRRRQVPISGVRGRVSPVPSDRLLELSSFRSSSPGRRDTS